MPTLDEFLKGAQRNAYVKFPGFASLYVRRTIRFSFKTLDIANLEARKPGGGSFTRLLKYVRTEYPELGIYVECVLMERFQKKLLALGFTRSDSAEYGTLGACFFLSPLMELK